MITDDTGTPGDGRWEVNVAWIYEDSGDATFHAAPAVDINYGIGDRIGLKLEFPWNVVSESASGSRSGLGNSVAGVKWRFRDAGDDRWRASVSPQVAFENPGSHSASRGLADEGETVELPFQFEREFGGVGVNVEVGRSWRSVADDGWFGGIAVGGEAASMLELVAEAAWEASAGFERASLTLNAGARITASERGALMISAGRTVYDRLEGAEATIGYVGWQFLF